MLKRVIGLGSTPIQTGPFPHTIGQLRERTRAWIVAELRWGRQNPTALSPAAAG